MEWKPIESAPKGGGAELVSDPNWVEPPLILLRCGDEAQVVAKWDWYYAEGGRGFTNGVAWVEPCSGAPVDTFYQPPTHWMPLPKFEEKQRRNIEPVDKSDYLFVISGRYEQSLDFARLCGITDRSRIRHINSIDGLMGVSGEGRTLYCYGTYYDLRDFRKLEEIARVRRFDVVFV